MGTDIKTEILSYAKEKGFIAGVCSSEPFDYLSEILIKTETPFVNYGVKERTDPTAVMAGCKSIIVAGAGYNKKVNIKRDKLACGAFSLGACGTDYHIALKEFLAGLAVHLKKLINFEYRIFVDTGPLVEREILYRAGVAWRGKNFCAVSDELGSMFNCGYMLTDIKFNFEPSGIEQLKSRCGGCMLCIKACPTGALKDGKFDYKKCISYLTQKKGTLTDEEEKLIGWSLYGCDICQLACPHNRGKETGEINDRDEIYPRLESLMALTKAEFREKYRERAFYWRGLGVIKRNAGIAYKNLSAAKL